VFLAAFGITLPEGGADDPATAATVHGVGRRKDELFHDRLRSVGVRVFPGAVMFLHELRAAGRRVAVVSASRNCRDVLRAAGIGDLFDVVVDGVIAGTPSAGQAGSATFLVAAERLGLCPRMLLIEDSLAGVEAGAAVASGRSSGSTGITTRRPPSRGSDVDPDLADLTVVARASRSLSARSCATRPASLPTSGPTTRSSR
jgi:HAD superfamily hydrolase (TIGR01509 family)